MGEGEGEGVDDVRYVREGEGGGGLRFVDAPVGVVDGVYEGVGRGGGEEFGGGHGGSPARGRGCV